jgi:transcriptional regulator with XRE-family HTH domain
MLLNRTEKEQRVIELYQQGKTIREIAQQVHMSFGYIGAIVRKVTGSEEDDGKPREQQQDNKPHTAISKDSQAFALFSAGKKPIEVAIKLDLGADVVDRLYQQFWRLEGLYQLNMVYKEIRRYLPSFLKLFKIMKQQKMMSEQYVVEALKFGKELPQLKDQFQLLVEEINSFEYKKNNAKTVLSALQNQISTTKDSLKLYQSAVAEKIQNIDEAHKKLAQLENIKNNNKDYQKIERLAEQKANDILSNKKAILTAAVISVFAALKNDPEKQLVIYDLLYNTNNNNSCYPSNINDDSILYTTSKIMSSSTANPENYLPSFVHRKVFEISEKFYDMLLKVAVNNAIYPISQQPRAISLNQTV